MPAFVAPQLCRLVDDPPAEAIWAHEIKFDGYRMQLRVEKHRAVLLTRKALDWSARFPEIVAEGRRLPDCLLDGEVCALNARGLPDFAALQQALSDGKTGGLVYYVFDLLFLRGEDWRELPLSARKERLAEFIGSQDLPHFRFVEHFATNGEAMLKSACRSGLEGIVSKRMDAPYRSGRHDSWTKEKCRAGQEVVIGGWWGGPSKLRSIIAGAYKGKDFAYLGRIGTGFNSQNSGPLLAKLKKIVRKTSPFTTGPKSPRTREISWIEPKLVAEVEYATITADGLLRQASFKALREDKNARAVRLEIPTPVEEVEKASNRENAPRAKQTPRNPRDDRVAGVAITNAEKILWSATKTTGAVTKLDLAQFYESIAARILPHIAGRPISMVRAPDGIGGQQFFQRHVLRGVPGARPIKIAGEKLPFHAIDDMEGLVGLAQAGVLEIHPWGAKKDAPEIPERLIFDLDPGPDLPFDNVIASAKEIGDLLRGVGFTPFVKTTGGKGIHVVVAIAGARAKPVTWDEAKAFALQFSERVARAAPDRYVTNMGKKHRGGKIFLDYLRNARMATAVAPYSPRARPGATVSVPLAWKDLRKGLDPKAFTILTIDKVLKRADPWKDFARSAASLETARKKLERAG